jgi:hypothetical protein
MIKYNPDNDAHQLIKEIPQLREMYEMDVHEFVKHCNERNEEKLPVEFETPEDITLFFFFPERDFKMSITLDWSHGIIHFDPINSPGEEITSHDAWDNFIEGVEANAKERIKQQGEPFMHLFGAKAFLEVQAKQAAGVKKLLGPLFDGIDSGEGISFDGPHDLAKKIADATGADVSVTHIKVSGGDKNKPKGPSSDRMKPFDSQDCDRN